MGGQGRENIFPTATGRGYEDGEGDTCGEWAGDSEYDRIRSGVGDDRVGGGAAGRWVRLEKLFGSKLRGRTWH